MMKILAIVFHLHATPHAVKVDHKADVRVSERIIDESKNGENSRKRQVRNMWRDEYKAARK